MNKLLVPSILGAIVLIAGIFALVPVDKASTIHSAIAGARLSEDIVTVIVADTDLVIECPAASTGCHILEVFVEDAEAGANDIDLGAATATVDGDAVVVSADLALVVNNARVQVPIVSGLAIGSGDILTLEVVDGTSESINYNMRVIALVQGAANIDART